MIRQLTLLGTAVAIYEVGCAIGALACAFVGNILGRRRTIFIAGCFVIIGVAIQASSFSLGQLIAGRIITGESVCRTPIREQLLNIYAQVSE